MSIKPILCDWLAIGLVSLFGVHYDEGTFCSLLDKSLKSRASKLLRESQTLLNLERNVWSWQSLSTNSGWIMTGFELLRLNLNTKNKMNSFVPWLVHMTWHYVMLWDFKLIVDVTSLLGGIGFLSLLLVERIIQLL